MQLHGYVPSEPRQELGVTLVPEQLVTRFGEARSVRTLTGEHPIQDASERVDVVRRLRPPSLVLLRRDESQRAGLTHQRSFVNPARDTKVAQERAAAMDQHVRGLEVTMDDSRGMHRVHSRGELRDHLEHHLYGAVSSGTDRRQCPVRGVRHDAERARRGGEGVQHADHVAMPNPPSRTRLDRCGLRVALFDRHPTRAGTERSMIACQVHHRLRTRAQAGTECVPGAAGRERASDGGRGSQLSEASRHFTLLGGARELERKTVGRSDLMRKGWVLVKQIRQCRVGAPEASSLERQARFQHRIEGHRP